MSLIYELVPAIVLLPLASFVLSLFVGRWMPKKGAVAGVFATAGSLGLSHNGNLVNADEIRDELANLGHAFTSDGDTEVIAHDIARNLLDEDLIQAVKHTMERLHGSYSLTIMHDESVIGVRDPQGNRPLCIWSA